MNERLIININNTNVNDKIKKRKLIKKKKKKGENVKENALLKKITLMAADTCDLVTLSFFEFYRNLKTQ